MVQFILSLPFADDSLDKEVLAAVQVALNDALPRTAPYRGYVLEPLATGGVTAAERRPMTSSEQRAWDIANGDAVWSEYLDTLPSMDAARREEDLLRARLVERFAGVKLDESSVEEVRNEIVRFMRERITARRH